MAQLAVSIAYVLYNSLFPRMLTTYEFSKFGHHRKTLRVSYLTGNQWFTCCLQPRYRHILPMLSALALAHFFISRGIYLVDIKIYNISGEEVLHRDHFAHATSGLALLLVFIVGTIVLFSLIGQF